VRARGKYITTQIHWPAHTSLHKWLTVHLVSSARVLLKHAILCEKKRPTSTSTVTSSYYRQLRRTGKSNTETPVPFIYVFIHNWTTRLTIQTIYGWMTVMINELQIGKDTERSDRGLILDTILVSARGTKETAVNWINEAKRDLNLGPSNCKGRFLTPRSIRSGVDIKGNGEVVTVINHGPH
jgi:hypothetical protein